MASLSIFSLEQTLHVVGVLSVLWIFLTAVWGFACAVRTYVLSEVWKGVDLASYGPWAVVTGATNGIGEAYSHELARRGLNVVLISRSLEKLKKVAAEIEEQHSRSTRVIQTDFTGGSEIYEPIRAALQGLEIGILVNNVAQSKDVPVSFLEVDNIDENICNIVHCNMLSTIKMTQIVLPQMVARKKGIIINVSSSLGNRPTPFTFLYSATKASQDFFSQGLDIEYRSKGIIVQSILPMFVENNKTTGDKKCYKVSAETFVRKALNTVGISNRTSGYLNHAIQFSLTNILFPDWLAYSSFGTAIFLFMCKLTSQTQDSRETARPERKGNQKD